MSGCGYLCPLCEGKTVLEDGTTCDWCQEKKTKPTPEEQAAWIEQVHNGPCCGDL